MKELQMHLKDTQNTLQERGREVTHKYTHLAGVAHPNAVTGEQAV